MAADDHERPTARPTAATAGPTTPDPTAHVRARDAEYVGTTLAGRYKILEKLGQGGMGAVYLAEHVLIEKKVAIKILTGDFARKCDLVERFAREAKAASKIGHENIINITDFGETPSGAAFFAMEHLAGRDLGRTVRSDGALGVGRVVRIAGQVCRALQAAHEKGIIHRDLKPENIFLVEREGRRDFVKVLDFGLAKVAVLNERHRLTRTGMIFGTAEYMSPEQARGEHADHRSDIYAMGCVLYELLTGDVPFQGKSFMELVRKQIEETPPPPSLRAPPGAVLPPLDAVVLKALAKDRDARFQSMKDLALALCAATGEDPRLVWGDQPVSSLPRTISDSDDASRTASPAETASPPESASRAENASAESAPPSLSALGLRPSRRRVAILALATVAAIATAIFFALRSNGPSSTARTLPAITGAPPSIARPATAPQAEARRAPPTIAPAPSMASATSHIVIRSTPSEAEVVNGAERLGRTPLDLALPRTAASFDVSVEHKGYKDQKLHIEPASDREYVVQLPIQPRAAHAPPSPKPADAPAHNTPAELKDVLSE